MAYTGTTAGILSNYAEVLKTFYLPAIQEQLNNATFLANKLETNETDISGKNATINLHYGRNSGTGARADGGALPDAGYQKHQTCTVPMRYQYGRVTFSGPTIAATRDQKGRYANVVDNEITGITRDLMMEVNRQYWGCGYGILARWRTTGSGTSYTLQRSYMNNTAGGDGFGGHWQQLGGAELARYPATKTQPRSRPFGGGVGKRQSPSPQPQYAHGVAQRCARFHAAQPAAARPAAANHDLAAPRHRGAARRMGDQRRTGASGHAVSADAQWRQPAAEKRWCASLQGAAMSTQARWMPPAPRHGRGLRPRTSRLQAGGFTLIEVLVALAILSISLMAGLRAASSMTGNAQRQWQVLLAQVCADNALHQLRVSPQFANVGEQSLDCPQAQFKFKVVLTVATTPNPSFRRVDAQVMDAQTPVLRITTVLGRY